MRDNQIAKSTMLNRLPAAFFARTGAMNHDGRNLI